MTVSMPDKNAPPQPSPTAAWRVQVTWCCTQGALAAQGAVQLLDATHHSGPASAARLLALLLSVGATLQPRPRRTPRPRTHQLPK